MNDLYAKEIRLFRNLFLPSVKLQRKVRVGSRTRRIYGLAQTPFERVCASPAFDAERIAELQRQQQQLDPFELARSIQAKLERIFQLSKELALRSEKSAFLQNDPEIARKQKPIKHVTVRTNSAKFTKPAVSKGKLRLSCVKPRGAAAIWNQASTSMLQGKGIYQ
jgi:hypothetical protein